MLGRNVFASSLSSEWRVLRSVAHLILIRHVLIEEGYFQNSDYSEDRSMKENTRESKKRSSEIYSLLKCINSQVIRRYDRVAQIKSRGFQIYALES